MKTTANSESFLSTGAGGLSGSGRVSGIPFPNINNGGARLAGFNDNAQPANNVINGDGNNEDTPAVGAGLIRSLLCIALFVTPIALVFGQASQLETDKGIAASIAPYPADVRAAILQASQYPQVLTKLQTRQTQTFDSFNDMIARFDQKTQGWFYTLTRYPDVLHTLATVQGRQNKEDVFKLLPNQDAALKEAAWKLYSTRKKYLVQLDNTNVAAQQDFDNNIQNLDAPAKAAFQKLATMPDVLTLLTNNIALTTRLGNHYKSDPAGVNDRLAALHDSLNVQNQYETAAFKKQMADDPMAAQEMTQAATAYGKSNGYDVPAQQYDETENDNYYANPYSYWFGYPGWYSYPLWYPGSFWYDTGLYFGAGGFGIWGLPGYGFSNWFFNGGIYNRYPNLYRQYGNYYRTNITEHRVMGPVNHGFMANAGRHFNPTGGARLNQLSTPGSYQRSNGQQPVQRSGQNTSRSNAATYHAQSWGAYGGRSSAPRGGGGGFRGGGGRH